MNRKPTAQTTNLPRGRRGHANHANGFSIGPGADRAGTDLCGLRGSVRDGLFGFLGGFGVPCLRLGKLGERRLPGSGFEPQRTQRFTENLMRTLSVPLCGEKCFRFFPEP